jgi:hypothetical protein
MVIIAGKVEVEALVFAVIHKEPVSHDVVNN